MITFEFFSIYLVWLVFLFTIGHFSLALFEKGTLLSGPTAQSVAARLAVGIILVSVGSSLWYAGWHTINIFWIPILFIAIRHLWVTRSHTVKSRKSKLSLPLLSAAVILCFALSYSMIWNSSDILPFDGRSDYIFYGKVAQFLVSSGQENYYHVLNNLDSSYNEPLPYHYFELWPAGWLGHLLDKNEFAVLYACIYPTFYLIVILLLLSLFTKQNLVTFLISFMLLFISGISFKMMDSRPTWLAAWPHVPHGVADLGFSKIGHFYVFLLGSFLLMRQRKYLLAFLSILVLPLTNILLAPTVWGSLFLVFSVMTFWSGDISVRTFSKAVAILFLIGIGVVWFYFSETIVFKFARADTAASAPFGITDLVGLGTWKVRFNIIASSAISLFLIFGPIAVIGSWYFLRFQRKFQKYFLHVITFVLGVAVLGALSWAFLHEMINSIQILFLSIVPVLNIAICLFIIHLFNQRNLLYRSAPVFLSGALLVFTILAGHHLYLHVSSVRFLNFQNRFSDLYLRELRETVPSGAVVGSWESDDAFPDPGAKNLFVYTLGNYLYLMDRTVHCVNLVDLERKKLAPPDDPVQKARNEMVLSHGAVKRYSRSLKSHELSSVQVLVSFMHYHSINYVVVGKGAVLPELLEKSKTLELIDEVSGQRLAVLVDLK